VRDVRFIGACIVTPVYFVGVDLRFARIQTWITPVHVIYHVTSFFVLLLLDEPDVSV
jgi:hypothetical protein